MIKPDLLHALLAMAMQCLHLDDVTVTFLEVLQRNGHDLHALLKAELSDSVNSDVNLQMYTSLQCLTSGGLIQCYCR